MRPISNPSRATATDKRRLKRAKLAFADDAMPGIRRRRSGNSFTYLRPNGRPLKDRRTLDRIQKLAIPPAYSDVWISPDPHGHVQATGRDDRGRKQYRYHPGWEALRDESKYGALAHFAAALPKLRQQVDADLRRSGTPRERVLASIVWLLDNTMIRVGNDAYARDNGSFGLTTLKARHLKIGGSTLRFTFRGKSGKDWNVRLVDRRMARILRSISELPGQGLFQYVDDDGKRRSVTSSDVNGYIRDVMGGDFSSKHFRTWGGTIAAAHHFRSEEVPDTDSGKRRVANAVVDKVASLLGNTRTVCRKCYIHPAVIESWSSGTLDDEMKAARRAVRKPAQEFDEIEATVAKLLERKAS